MMSVLLAVLLAVRLAVRLAMSPIEFHLNGLRNKTSHFDLVGGQETSN